ncbi:hypothetical protein [uncultured Roseovarius sp.]|uniref:hypothetical protein n=1 Tax=uncultured Roseovarius sp. TaxID=293344 RepID=UPI0026369DCB|nr:hypothetical protein [uncultured Roseovarius sp.]
MAKKCFGIYQIAAPRKSCCRWDLTGRLNLLRERFDQIARGGCRPYALLTRQNTDFDTDVIPTKYRRYTDMGFHMISGR